jgi:hypothetical protein
LIFTIKSPQRRGQYKLSEVHHNLSDSRTTPSPSRGWIPKSNEHTKLVDEVLELKIEWVTQRMAQIFPRNLGLEWSLRERDFKLKSVSQSVFQMNRVASWVKEAWGAFYTPQGNLPVGVSETQTCPCLGLDMSGQPYWNPTGELDKFGFET